MHINCPGLHDGTGSRRLRGMVHQDFNHAARRSRCIDQARIFDALCRPQHDPATFQARSRRLNKTAVLQGAGKNAHCIALQGAQIDGCVRRCLDLQADTFEAASRDLDLPACRQDRAAVRGLDQRIFAGIDLRTHQHHIAAARQNGALHRNTAA